MIELTKQEEKILLQLHLQGFVKWGSMKKNKRINILKDLTKKGYLDDNCKPTQKAIDELHPTNNL